MEVKRFYKLICQKRVLEYNATNLRFSQGNKILIYYRIK